MNQDGPVPAVPCSSHPLRTAEFLLQGLDHLQGIHLQVGQGEGIPTMPTFSPRVDGGQVG